MGVGEDESLGDAIAVTVIATGFNAEQQNEIVNTEPKKIIHSLDNESKMEQNLLKKEETPLINFAFEQEEEEETIIEATIQEEKEEEKVVFTLEEEETPIAEEPKFEIFETELIPTSEFIKNLDVVFEIVPAKTADFTIATPAPIKEEEIAFEVKTVVEEVQEQRNEFLFDISAETKEMKVNDPIRVVPVTEVSEVGITRYSLEEYMEVEKQLMDSKPKVKTEEVPAELNFTLKQEIATPQAVKEEEIKEPAFRPSFEELPATEMTIEEALRARADERRRKMKEFNYKFHNSISRIEEIEKVPAYRRQNIDLSQNESLNGISRTSLSTDSNNDLQLRNNNSFLHDNVD
jgi:cell division protein FtsZ